MLCFTPAATGFGYIKPRTRAVKFNQGSEVSMKPVAWIAGGAVLWAAVACRADDEYAPAKPTPQTWETAFFAPWQPPTVPAFKPVTVIPRSFPPIKNAPTIPADEAGELLRDDDLVLGVEVNGQARAYPINLLCGPQREIINDVLGGQAIAATW